MLHDLTARLARGAALAEEQIRAAVAELVREDAPAELKADFLSALARKGETMEEIAAFARLLRERAVAVPLDEETRRRVILDVVGAGGDRLRTINISSTAALLCAAAGVPVAKHGNRAVTSACGSADMLEALGVPLHLPPAGAAAALRERGFAFLFAPDYHPAFKHIAPARKLCAERGQRTIFNFLGPLLNPARPTAMLLGVPRPEMCEPIARVLRTLGVRRAMVVCGEVPGGGTTSGALDSTAYLDEISPLGPTTVAEFDQEHGLAVSQLRTGAFPLQPATLADLVGGDKAANAAVSRAILRGEERGPKRDAVLLNAAAALFVAGRSGSVPGGWELAAELVASGKAGAKLDQITGAQS